MHPTRHRPESGTSRALLVAAFVCLTLIWGTTWAAIRVGLEGLPPLTGVALRFVIAAAALLAACPLFGVRLTSTARVRVIWVVTAVFSYGVTYVVIYWAEQWVPSGLAAVLFATYPLMVAVLAHWLLPGERLTRFASLGIAGGFAGVALIFSEDFERLGGEQVAFASVIALASPLSAAIGSVVVKRWGSGIHPLSLTAVPMALTAAGVAPLALWLERGRTLVFDARSVGARLYLAIVGTAVTFVIYFGLLSRVPASRAALIAYTTPLVAVATGVVAFGEPVTPRTAAGALLVVLGVALAAGRRRQATGEAGARR